ncbi:MAG TPA: TetR/AcrR family transcriptional regulator [Phycisphaerales bacterium]|nr:TetR/AcrR family transcriptional regulator [Phycisphaerales bacterium]
MERRQDILNAAQAVFDMKGYTESTVEEIAGKANISKGSVYNYFGSKEELFAAVFAEALAADHSVVDGLIGTNAPASQKLQGLLDHVFERLEAHTLSGRLIMELWAVAAKKAELADAMAQIHAY